jgi:general secretion pathway protein G
MARSTGTGDRRLAAGGWRLAARGSRPAAGGWRLVGRGSRRAAGGWTLIELVIVMAIIVILAGLAIASYRNSVTLAQEAALREDLFRMRDAIDQHYADKNKYPASLQDLVSGGYLRAIPEDPITRSTTTWQEVQSEPDPANPSLEPGVTDVKSGSDKEGSNGQPYNEW